MWKNEITASTVHAMLQSGKIKHRISEAGPRPFKINTPEYDLIFFLSFPSNSLDDLDDVPRSSTFGRPGP